MQVRGWRWSQLARVSKTIHAGSNAPVLVECPFESGPVHQMDRKELRICDHKDSNPLQSESASYS